MKFVLSYGVFQIRFPTPTVGRKVVERYSAENKFLKISFDRFCLVDSLPGIRN